MAKLKLWEIILIFALVMIVLGGLGWYFINRSDKKALLAMPK